MIRRRPSGFTLIELLVVVAIISLLVSILLPSLKKARDLAKMTVCATHERQFGVAVVFYADDNNGEWSRYVDTGTNPDNGGWTTSATWMTVRYNDGPGYEGIGRTYPYLKDKAVYNCPADDVNGYYQTLNWDDPFVNPPNPNSGALPNLWCSYCIRGWDQSYNHNNTGGSPGKKLEDVANRALVSCFFMYNPEGRKPRLTFHNGKYPVLFGGGDVVMAPMPDFIDPADLPDIWDFTWAQRNFWDSFDKSR